MASALAIALGATTLAAQASPGSTSVGSAATNGKGAKSHPQNIKANVPNADPKNWELVSNLSDEFNGTTVDTGKWNNSPTSWGAWTWNADNTSVKDGSLELRMRYDEQPNATLRRDDYTTFKSHTYFSSGILQSKASSVYGYYEARIKGVDTFPGSAPAFWLYSNYATDKAAGFLGTQDGDTAYSEVDIVEMQQHSKDAHLLDLHAPYQVMQNGNPVWIRNAAQAPYLDQSVVNGGFDPAADYHTYGVMVAPDRLTYYLDGKPVNSIANTNWNRLPMNVTLSLGLRDPNLRYGTESDPCPGGARRCANKPTLNSSGGVDGYPTHMSVDWVRVYRMKPGTVAP
ncbi:family 16 glycosylhydrolase [Streptomyces griseoincarnatus]